MSNSKLKYPTKPYETYGGAHVPHMKNTQESQSVMMPPPARVTISMQQHLGAPCEPIVKKGDYVTVGQKIADSSKLISAPIHASVSGTVESIGEILLSNGSKAKTVVIESDGLMTPCPDLAPVKVTTAEELIKAVHESGLVGLGGAGFPAYVKLNISPDKKIDTLIINGAECEPFITTDYREMIENSQDVLEGVYLIKELLGIERGLICIESNKPKAIEVLSRIADNTDYDPENKVRLLTLRSSYPQGAEKIIVQAATGRKIPKGKLPADVGCIVMNITSVAFIARYLRTGMPLVSKRVTVDGSAIKEPKNVIVPVGTPINEVIEFCGGYKCEPKKILMGGPMMGIAIYDVAAAPILKQNNAIIAFDEKDAQPMEQTECIHCGRCVEACPMSLMPTELEKSTEKKDADALIKYGIESCMECGTCAFCCPAGRNLVQAMRLGKQIVRRSKEVK